MVVTRKGPTGRYIIVSFTETECGERKGLTHTEKRERLRKSWKEKVRSRVERSGAIIALEVSVLSLVQAASAVVIGGTGG